MRLGDVRPLRRTGFTSALRHLLRVAAPGMGLSERGRSAVRLPRRIRADIAQARRVSGIRAGIAPRPRTLWVFHEKLPDPSGDSGSLRLTWILVLACRLGYDVSLYSVRERSWSRVAGVGDELSVTDASHDGDVVSATVAWVAAPQAAAVVMPVLANGPMRVIYDSVDLHYRRLEREADVMGSRGRRLQARLMRELERRAVAAADITIAISDEEVRPLHELGAADVVLLPNIHPPRADPPPLRAARAGLLFVGNYTHSPNVDAVDVLLHEVMPRVWRRLPELELMVVGRAFPSHHFKHLDPRVRVLGWVRDLDAVVDATCLLAAPLRFGAGLKGKIGYAMARGLPVVTTTIGAEGFPDVSAMAVCDVGDWDAFATCVVELLESESLWVARSEAGPELVREQYAPDAVCPRLASILDGA